MKLSILNIAIAIVTSLFSGFATAYFSNIKHRKIEQIRQHEKQNDLLRIDLRDLQIDLYKLEKDLSEWKDKYYEAIQELISVRAELEITLIKLTHAGMHED
jgi:hypothetical protein